MSNIKHTVGPWTYKADDGTKQILIGEKSGQEACLCSVFPQPSLGVSIKTANANAKLIAAAPELLEALICVDEILGKDSEGKPMLKWFSEDEIAAKARIVKSAIKKATE